jgi:hypothetical protein
VRAAALALLLAGCSVVVDGSEPLLPLVGAPLDLAGRPRVVREAGEAIRILPGDDGVPWAALYRVLDVGLAVFDLRLVRLAEPQTEIRFDGHAVWVGSRAIYEFVLPPSDGPDADRLPELRVHHPGAATPVRTIAFPQRAAVETVLPLADDRAFAILPGSLRLSAAVVHTESGRAVAVPSETLARGAAWVDTEARHLYTLEEDAITARGLAGDEPARVVAAVDPTTQLRFDTVGERAASCGPAGLTVATSDGDRRLHDGCAMILALTEGWAWFRADARGPILGVPLDGSARARIASTEEARLLTARGAVAVTTTTAGDVYRGGAGDGWIGERRIMQRGRALGFTADGTALLWLENAANDSATGALRHAPVDGDARTLDRNVLRWAALADGRILAAANRAQVGAHNRIDLIDLRAGVRRPLAVAASDFVFSPEDETLLVRTITLDDDRETLVLVPIPEQNR